MFRIFSKPHNYPKNINLNEIHVFDLTTAFLEACFNPRIFQLFIIINILGLSLILLFLILNKTEFDFLSKTSRKKFQETQSRENWLVHALTT